MKKLSTMFAVLLFGTVIAASGCKKDEAKKDDKAAKKPDEKKPDEAKPDEAKPDEAKPTEGGGGAATGLAECDAYVAAVEAYMKCDKVPQEARDGAKSGIEAMKQGWGDTSAMPEEAKKQTNDACKQATDALKQGATAMGCTI
jgi:hypothetical protein